jgi:hypothetical protein
LALVAYLNILLRHKIHLLFVDIVNIDVTTYSQEGIFLVLGNVDTDGRPCHTGGILLVYKVH